MDATYYEGHKDDPELWGDPEESAPGRRDGLTATITVRFSSEEADGIRRIAKEAGLSYSEVVRRAVQHFTQPRPATEAAQERHASMAPGATVAEPADAKGVVPRPPDPEMARPRTG